MKTKSRRRWWILGGIVLWIIAAIVGTLLMLARDEDPPAVGDLVDFRRTVPDRENGRVVLNLREGSVKWPEIYSEEEEELEALREKFDTEKAAQLIEDNRNVLERLDRALAARDFQFHSLTNFADDSLNAVMDFRNLARVLFCQARLLLEQKDTRGVLGEIRKAFALGRKMQEGQGSLIQYLVGLWMQQAALKNIRTWLPQLDLAAEDIEAMHRMIEEELASREAICDVHRAEFVLFSNAIEAVEKGEVEDLFGDLGMNLPSLWNLRLARLFFLPNQTRRFMAEETRIFIENANKLAADRKFEDFIDKYELHKWTSLLRNFMGKQMLGMFIPATGGALFRRDCLVADARATRAIIALHAYRKERGNLPDSLDDLVPEYLPAVPKDPFDDQPLRYSREKGSVYSIGRDLTDGGGSDEEPSEAGNDLDEPTFWIDAPVEKEDPSASEDSVE